MKKTFLLLFPFALVFNSAIKAQGKSDYRKSFTEGSFLILENNYSQALKSFLEAYKIDSVNANINYKIGLCYLKTVSEKGKATPYLEKAIANTSKKYTDMEPQEKSAPIQAFYYYGQALHINYRFDEAIANYEMFKSFLSSRQANLINDANRQIEISNNAKILVAAPINVLITNLGDSINTSYPDYSPLVSADEKTIIFTSRRPGSTGGDKTPEGEFYDDIYISYKKKDSTWTSPVSISPNINTITNEGSVGLSADAQTLIIYKDINGGDLYYSTLDGSNWTFPQSMGTAINTPSFEPSACLSPDGKTLYFVSDRKEGLGGRDIWKSTKLADGSWGTAQNVGAPINTAFDEESPFIHPSGNVLFFGSQGHKSIGGFDIFSSTKGDKGWEEPVNMGYPINTTDDDLFYVTSPDGKRGYYSSSSRPEGYGEKDIYMISIPERKKEALVFIKGTIIPAQSEQLPSDIEIVATNNETGIVSGTYSPLVRDGSFTIIIPPGSNYNLSYQRGGEEFFNETMEVPADAVYQEIIKVIHLKPIIPGQLLAIIEDKEENNGENVKPSEAMPVEASAIVVDKVKLTPPPVVENKKETAVKDTPKAAPVVNKEQLAKVDKLDFQMYFKYNVIEVDVNDEPFKKFIDNLVELQNTNGMINIKLVSSASEVPTRMFTSNEELAATRSKKTKEQLLEALKSKGVDTGKVKFTSVKSKVSGPKYTVDYHMHRSEYEKHQYVKVNAY